MEQPGQPQKVQEMLHELKIGKANHMVTLALEMLELEHYEVGSTLLDDARKMLAKADRALSEAQMILSGFSNAKKEPTLDQPDVAGETDAD